MNKQAFKKDIKDVINTMTYVEALKSGFIDYDNIDDYIDEWHDNNGFNMSISQYFGMTKEQYFEYIKGHEEALRKIFPKN